MAQVRQHLGAKQTPAMRRAMVDVLVVEGWSVAATAERFQVDPKTVRKWRDRYLHTALDDHSRLAYSEHLNDERGDTAAAFWRRACAWFAAHGVTCEGVITDNGGCYRSRAWHKACKRTATKIKKTRPYRPQTNGKVERFHRILLEEWAYIRPWTSEHERQTAYAGFLH